MSPPSRSRRPEPDLSTPSADPAMPSSPDDSDTPSKSQRKRDSHALQALGAELVDLREDVLLRLPIDEELLDAVRMARSIRAREGRRRQLQLIGKLMRRADAEAIRAALSLETREHRVATAVMHAAESWRERILADDRVLKNWLAEFPDSRADIEKLVAGARAEQASGSTGRAFRELYRRLREHLEERR